VHISALSNTFVKDPHSVVKAGQVVKVKVLEVDIPRHRIALTMRLGDEVTAKRGEPGPRRDEGAARRDRATPQRGEGGQAPRGEQRPRGGDDRRPPAQGKGGARQEASRPAAGNALAEAFARARGGK
jgi:uncharacterized protein